MKSAVQRRLANRGDLQGALQNLISNRDCKRAGRGEAVAPARNKPRRIQYQIWRTKRAG
jgi:hypothetical protein